MDRKTVLLDEAQLERQREYTRQLAALHQQRGKPVYALVDTFGCQQNVADSQHILGMLRDMGCQFTDDAAQADIVVLNTCAIRDHAEKRVYGNLGALTHTKKQNPEQVICLCYSPAPFIFSVPRPRSKTGYPPSARSGSFLDFFVGISCAGGRNMVY